MHSFPWFHIGLQLCAEVWLEMWLCAVLDMQGPKAQKAGRFNSQVFIEQNQEILEKGKCRSDLRHD